MADRVVMGKWDGQDGGYIGGARHYGGILYDTGGDAWDALRQGLQTPAADALGWQVNEQFLQNQMQNGVWRIEYVVDHSKFASIEDVVRLDPNSFSAKKIRYSTQNAATHGYERVGETWVRMKGSPP